MAVCIWLVINWGKANSRKFLLLWGVHRVNSFPITRTGFFFSYDCKGCYPQLLSSRAIQSCLGWHGKKQHKVVTHTELNLCYSLFKLLYFGVKPNSSIKDYRCECYCLHTMLLTLTCFWTCAFFVSGVSWEPGWVFQLFSYLMCNICVIIAKPSSLGLFAQRQLEESTKLLKC